MNVRNTRVVDCFFGMVVRDTKINLGRPVGASLMVSLSRTPYGWYSGFHLEEILKLMPVAGLRTVMSESAELDDV
jgi:hypothetical protein